MRIYVDQNRNPDTHVRMERLMPANPLAIVPGTLLKKDASKSWGGPFRIYAHLGKAVQSVAVHFTFAVQLDKGVGSVFQHTW